MLAAVSLVLFVSWAVSGVRATLILPFPEPVLSVFTAWL